MSTFPDLGPVYASSGPVYREGWDRIEFGGWQAPGEARIVGGVGARYKLDPKRAPGKKGSLPTYHGIDPGTLDVEIRVWTQPQLDALKQLCDLFSPAPELKALPVTIVSPQLGHLAPVFSQAVCIEVGPLLFEPALGVMGRKVSMRWQQHIPPTRGNATTTPKKPPLRTPANLIVLPTVANPPPASQPDVAAPPPAVAQVE